MEHGIIAKHNNINNAFRKGGNVSVTIPTSVVRDFTTSGPIQRVYEILADVPNSVSHFPKV